MEFQNYLIADPILIVVLGFLCFKSFKKFNDECDKNPDDDEKEKRNNDLLVTYFVVMMGSGFITLVYFLHLFINLAIMMFGK